jgi:hypothetical protein
VYFAYKIQRETLDVAPLSYWLGGPKAAIIFLLGLSQHFPDNWTSRDVTEVVGLDIFVGFISHS